MGDFNWVTPQFLAFASPQHQPTAPISQSSPLFATLPTNVHEINAAKIPTPFKNVLSHFKTRNIGLVVRLNSELYCPSYFTALGINHIDMIFEDGTCPPLPLVRKFIKLAHETINIKHKGIAVHCKAGLGRTGCLIGAYLIYRHGFTANEVIAFMRFMRPGMVVGPQQHWLHLHQNNFREWWFEDTMKEKYAALNPVTPRKASSKQRLISNGQTATPPNQSKRAALGEIDNVNTTSNYQDENLPAPTPGQPRKTARQDSRHHPYARSTSAGTALTTDADSRPSTEVVSMRAHRQSQGGSESEEEYTLRMLAHRKSKSPDASHNDKPRSVSYTTTTTMTTKYDMDDDVENWTDNNGYDDALTSSVNRPKTPGSTKSGSGSGTIGVAKTRASPRRSGDSRGEAKVRKTSGRVVSQGGTAVRNVKSN